ncbi:ATP-binding protein [Agrococcus sp. 1P02AA]|uniref:ATP-binding protein n=1 Tax=Agrococcus sp. 1P02AA TaxID=3132259 RepID=UPI0039A707B4
MPTDDPRSTTIEGPADLRFVDTVIEALDALCEAAGDVDAEDRVLFQLAVTEVATNIAEHGLPPGEVRVMAHLEVRPTHLAATFTDTAVPAEVELHDAAMPGPLEESGRGIALAAAALERFEHERRGGNVWRLRRDRLGPRD